MALTNEEQDAAIARDEHRALKLAALAAAIAIAWLVMPIGLGILLGMLLAFVMQPLYARLKPRLGAAWSALVVVSGATLALAAGCLGLAWLLVARGVSLARELIALLGPGGMGDALLGWLGRVTARVGVTPEELTQRVRAVAEQGAARVAGEAEVVAGALASLLLAGFFALLSMHFMLRRWESVSLSAQATLPLRPDYTRALFAEFRRVGRMALMGTVATGLVQGALATVGYWIAGVPEPIFFGAVTAVASLLPVAGTMLVWLPAGIALILTGHPARGVFELLWGGLVVVALCDYVIRPRLVGSETEVPSLVTFAALFGGVEVFGLEGLIVGPVVMSLAVAVLRLYARETRDRRRLAPMRERQLE